MAGPKSIAPAHCVLTALSGLEDPCLLENPNRPTPSDLVETIPKKSQTGYASWYGPAFQAGPTSNGEVFDTYDYTIAHRELPKGSLVLLQRLDDKGQSIPNAEVVARVTDWGPALTVKRKTKGPDGKEQIIDVPILGADGKPRVADLSKATMFALGGDAALKQGEVRINITPVKDVHWKKIGGYFRIVGDRAKTRADALTKKWAFEKWLGYYNGVRVRTIPDVEYHKLAGHPPKRSITGYSIVVETPIPFMADELFSQIAEERFTYATTTFVVLR